MTLWRIIRDFFVQNFFGGYLGNGNQIWMDLGKSNNQAYYTYQMEVLNIGGFSVNLGDWLSTTFTIITLILIIIFLYIFVKWIFKLFSGLLR